MTKTESLITWGLLALIAYELWPKTPQAGMQPFRQNNESQTPTWIQNLSYDTMQDDSYSTDDISNLLSIPQGPGGGTTQWGAPPGGFFNPIGGLVGQCVQQPSLTPSVFKVS